MKTQHTELRSQQDDTVVERQVTSSRQPYINETPAAERFRAPEER